MFLFRALYMVVIRQFFEELAIYFQCCLSAPYLTYCLVFSLIIIWTVLGSVALELSIPLLLIIYYT